MKAPAISICLLLSSSVLYGQGLELSRGTRDVSIPEGTFLTIRIANASSTLDAQCCYDEYQGRLTSVDRSTVHLELARHFSATRDGELYTTRNIHYPFNGHQPDLFPIAKEAIVLISRSPTPRQQKSEATWNVIGGTLLLSGLGTWVATLVVDGKANRSHLRDLAVAEVVAGLTIGLVVNSRRKYEVRDGMWRIKS
ncbi:MAG: hypothetical protein R3301_17280 [Saprospiraceae bacterium]|nr:hypothetical protein [Saprospiraceae bacterium]